MNLIKSAPGVFTTDEDLVVVDETLIELLRTEAPASLRKRVRFNAHATPGEVVQEMILCLAHDTYIAPHKHCGKTESFHIIEGELDIVLFEDDGKIREVIRMGAYGSGKPFYQRTSHPFFHAVVVQSATVVFQETTKGPFIKDETIFAPWAPSAEGENAERFLAALRETLSGS